MFRHTFYNYIETLQSSLATLQILFSFPSPFQSFSRQIVFMWRQALKSGGSNNNEHSNNNNMGKFMLCANLQTTKNEERT